MNIDKNKLHEYVKTIDSYLDDYLTCHDRIEKALLKINQIEQEIFSSKNMLLKKSLNDIRKILLGYGSARECYLDKSLKNNEI